MLWIVIGVAVAYRRSILNRFMVAVWIASVAIVSITPASHELRYQLFIPLSGVFLVVAAMNSFKVWERNLLKMAMIVSAVIAVHGAWVKKLVPTDGIDASPAWLTWENSLWIGNITRVTARDVMPPMVQRFWEYAAQSPTHNSFYCIPDSPYHIFFTGPTFTEFKIAPLSRCPENGQAVVQVRE
jgi:hypothetical protein